MRHLQNHLSVIEKSTRKEKIGDFDFELAPLVGDEEQPETITSTAQTLFSIISYLSSVRRTGLRYLFFGHKLLNSVGNYWSGRPHIHIVRHSNQAETASMNENRNKGSFGWIIARAYGEGASGEKYLPESNRIFEDYRAYIALSGMLWVWSKNGLHSQDEWDEPNRGHLIYENEAQGCLVEYGYMLNKSLSDSLSEVENISSQEILNIRRFIVDLKSRMLHSSHYGEVGELLIDGCEALGLSKLQAIINENISILEIEAKLSESKRSDRLGRAIALVFGFISIPVFADSIVKPVWYYFDLWHPENPNLVSLMINLVTAVMIFAVVITLFRLITFKGPR